MNKAWIFLLDCYREVDVEPDREVGADEGGDDVVAQ